MAKRVIIVGAGASDPYRFELNGEIYTRRVKAPESKHAAYARSLVTPFLPPVKPLGVDIKSEYKKILDKTSNLSSNMRNRVERDFNRRFIKIDQ